MKGISCKVYKFFNSKSKGAGIKNEIKENQRNFLQNSKNLLANSQLANELHKPIIRKFKKEKCILVLKTVFGLLI